MNSYLERKRAKMKFLKIIQKKLLTFKVSYNINRHLLTLIIYMLNHHLPIVILEIK